MKPFDLKKAFSGKKVITRDRRSYAHSFSMKKSKIKITKKNEYIVKCLIGRIRYKFTVDGKFQIGKKTGLDLLME